MLINIIKILNILMKRVEIKLKFSMKYVTAIAVAPTRSVSW